MTRWTLAAWVRPTAASRICVPGDDCSAAATKSPDDDPSASSPYKNLCDQSASPWVRADCRVQVHEGHQVPGLRWKPERVGGNPDNLHRRTGSVEQGHVVETIRLGTG